MLFTSQTHKKVFLLISISFAIAGCSTTVHQEVGNIKRIEQRGAAIWSTSPRAAYAHHETQTGLKVISLRECPNGYQLLEERYVPKTKEKKDMLVWRIRCLEEKILTNF